MTTREEMKALRERQREELSKVASGDPRPLPMSSWASFQRGGWRGADPNWKLRSSQKLASEATGHPSSVPF